FFFFFSSRRRHTRSYGDWSSDVCSSDLLTFNAHVDTSVLRQSFFGNVHAAHDFDARNDCCLKSLQLRRQRNLVQDAVNTITNSRSEERRVGKECRSRWWV